MKKYLTLLLLVAGILSCKRDFQVIIPNTDWDLFNSPSAKPLNAFTRSKAEGVFSVEQGDDAFGPLAPAKWSYTANGTDTVFRLSFFLEKASAYFICEGKQLDTSILLNGYWRRMTTTETGRVRLTIAKENGGRKLLSTTAFNPLTDTLLITGVYSLGINTPDVPIRLRYLRPLYKATPFQILAHRGGGRSADLLPASENSVEMIKLASGFGATGIEIDVRMTKDGIPVLFHDATLNERVIQKNGLLGPIQNYTFAQLSALVRLSNGERIPTLRQALETVVFNTPLQFVWLDTKYNGSLQILKDMQSEFLAKAAAFNRTLEIMIGIPDKDVLANFKKLPGYQNVPSLCELTLQNVLDVNAKVWAPQWTLGLQNDEVATIQAQGRRAFVWTLDISENIAEYIEKGKFNGILSNYPSAVAYHYYVRQ